MGDWRNRAACRGLHSTDEAGDPMFPVPETRGTAVRRAKRLCMDCPVRVECLAEALEYDAEHGSGDVLFGIRGGLGTRERDAHRAGWPIRACAKCLLIHVDPEGRDLCGACRPPGRPQAPPPPPAADAAEYKVPPSDEACGSTAGTGRHRRRKEPICDLCRYARRVYERQVAASPRGRHARVAQLSELARELAPQPLTPAQAAQRMGCSKSTAVRYLAAARAQLAEAA